MNNVPKPILSLGCPCPPHARVLGQSEPAEVRVLVIGADAPLARALQRASQVPALPCTIHVVRAGTPTAARAALAPKGMGGLGIHVVVVPLSDVAADRATSPSSLAGDILRSGAALVFSMDHADLDAGARALALGAADIVDPAGLAPEHLAERLLAAAQRSRALPGRYRRNNASIRRRKRVSGLRRALQRQPGVGHSDAGLRHSRRCMGMNQVSVASEFKGLIRQELDIESLLRTTLEFVLARSGPTNAAIFLPTTSGDYSLGAYVNYDCPKDTCDILLDHMANVVAPKFERQIGIAHITSQVELQRRIGDDAAWLGDSGVLAMACRHDGETLAVVLLFRDRKSTYTPSLIEQVRTVGDLFACQLARVIHIHHRHLPKDKWGMLGDAPSSEDDYGDLAA